MKHFKILIILFSLFTLGACDVEGLKFELGSLKKAKTEGASYIVSTYDGGDWVEGPVVTDSPQEERCQKESGVVLKKDNEVDTSYCVPKTQTFEDMIAEVNETCFGLTSGNRSYSVIGSKTLGHSLIASEKVLFSCKTASDTNSMFELLLDEAGNETYRTFTEKVVVPTAPTRPGKP